VSAVLGSASCSKHRLALESESPATISTNRQSLSHTLESRCTRWCSRWVGTSLWATTSWTHPESREAEMASSRCRGDNGCVSDGEKEGGATRCSRSGTPGPIKGYGVCIIHSVLGEQGMLDRIISLDAWEAGIDCAVTGRTLYPRSIDI